MKPDKRQDAVSSEVVLKNIPGFWFNPTTGNTWNFYFVNRLDKISKIAVRQKKVPSSIFFEYCLTKLNDQVVINIDGIAHPIISFTRSQFTFTSNEFETITLFRINEVDEIE